jgi:hypothetical protein
MAQLPGKGSGLCSISSRDDKANRTLQGKRVAYPRAEKAVATQNENCMRGQMFFRD